jgi:hypothetical protein
MPARVSVLMLPARGWVARLLNPFDASAVIGRIFDAAASTILRSCRLIRRWRSFVTVAPLKGPSYYRVSPKSITAG